ncbi:YbeD family protein [Amnimonas aquatica]|jgi:putative lipoic acid-binding regulatory protein|uniref:UPF0250 protein C5O18_04235 n=1 Tax=Amnimonas aquatica TaxID=2094561 RepID=A0A2P6AT67_9GAMM|nr:DUF493 domain-containing protein [Amnimonas aquatica]PQA46748.1 hypothetical protein C5O18_04235 [Amnimonas aquatica]
MTTKSTDIQNEELWQFPVAAYPLKVMGEARFPLAQIVADIIRRHVPDFDPATIEMQPSSKGTYVSVRATFPVERKEQINGLYADLAAEPAVKMAL